MMPRTTSGSTKALKTCERICNWIGLEPRIGFRRATSPHHKRSDSEMFRDGVKLTRLEIGQVDRCDKHARKYWREPCPERAEEEEDENSEFSCNWFYWFYWFYWCCHIKHVRNASARLIEATATAMINLLIIKIRTAAMMESFFGSLLPVPMAKMPRPKHKTRAMIFLKKEIWGSEVDGVPIKRELNMMKTGKELPQPSTSNLG